MKAQFSKNLMTISYKDSESEKFEKVREKLLSDVYVEAMGWNEFGVNYVTFSADLIIADLRHDYSWAKSQ